MMILPILALFLAQQIITPPTASSESSILSLLQKAQECCDLKEWSSAFDDYQKILAVDSNNIAAHLGLKLVDQQRSHESLSPAHQEQEKMVKEVDAAWELPIDKKRAENPISPFRSHDDESIQTISEKLQNIKLRSVELSDMRLRDAIEWVQRKSIALDQSESDSKKKGINIILDLDYKTEQSIADRKINLSLTDVTLEELLVYIAQETHLKIKKDPYAILFISPKEEKEYFITKEYTVPPNFIEKVDAPQEATSKEHLPSLTETKSAKEFLLAQGVTFPPGTTATYLGSSNTLLVKNSQANLDLIESLLKASLTKPKSQIEIETRFIEIKQNRLKERGFDWLLGSCQLPLSKGIDVGGGTTAHQNTYNGDNYPFQQNGSPIGNIAGGAPGAGSLTSGNRFGNTAITPNALDSLLFGNATGPATGVLALAGVLTNPQFQVILRAINEQKAANLLSAPKVSVTSGRTATITVAREFPYPADYSPPQVPENQGSGVNPAVPATPSNFKTRHVGVELQVSPILGPDASTIELNLAPQTVEFQGFVDYGTPIFSQAPSFLGGQTNAVNGTSQVLLTANSIKQPVFSVRQVETTVSLHDGETVVLGGLMRDDVQKVNDKVPIIGDVPLIGQLFRSSSQQHIKRNLVIFVTVRLLNNR